MELISLRKSSGKTQEEVAEYLGISRTAYNHIENGRRNPSLKAAIKLAELFGLSIKQMEQFFLN